MHSGYVRLSFLATAFAAAALAQSRVDFARDIQPVFAKSCYACHSEKRQMAGLRLDSRASVLAKSVQPGKSAASELYRRVAGIGDQARMPMGGKLDPADIERVRQWIDQGAEWPESLAGARATHWGFTPPVRAAIPKGAASPIDAFILARLAKEGLKPAPEASRPTLLRRLSLDLTGLPPTPAEIDAFLRDTQPGAYERQVDRLLASPHYGERQARTWLDGARYADSDGFEKDKQRQVWFYRDWVINAFNRNMPYDRFIIEQIAGDLLPNATQDQIVATGFLRNAMTNEEGGIDPEQFRMEAMFDRMDAIGKGILGVTIQCAQCHNHKFDPLKQEEYYRMFAFLNDSHEANIAVYTPPEQMKRADILRETRELEGGLEHRTPDWADRMAQWEYTVRNPAAHWTIVRPEVDDISTGGQKYLPMEDGSFLAQGYAPTKHTVKLTVKTDLKNIAAFRLELLKDANLPRGGPGRSVDGTLALTEFRVEAAPASDPTKPVAVTIARATADVNPAETPLDPLYSDKSDRRRVTGPVTFAIDGKEETAWGIDSGPGDRNQPRKAVFNAAAPIANEGGVILTFYLKQNHGGWNSDDNQNNNLGRFRLSITSDPDAVADPLPANVRSIIAKPRAERTPAEQQAVFHYWRTTVPEWKPVNDRIAALWRDYPEGSTQLVYARRDTPRETHILARGDFLKPAALVTPGVPAFLNPLPAGDPPTRLTFAKWMVDRRSPTTARSFVNRLWQAYFGIGIVATAENFGTQAEAPSHPELLDWLAVEFMESGWDVKHMARLIVTSDAYKRSSAATPELTAQDPYNRLLARGPRFRVDAEVVRDIALAASGLLNGKVGGPSVFPPAPAFLFVAPASYSPKVWIESKGDEKYRRALYTFRYRSVPYPALQTFDAPNGETSCVRRGRSNTPLQALTLLNEPVFLDAARALATLTLREGGATDQQRFAYAFRRCTGRQPDASDGRVILPFLEKQKQRLRDGWLSALDLAGLDDAAKSALPKGATPVDAAAWTAVSRVLLNLDETITKE
ncbi:MAG: PSD1 domain-containing protein [Acidobacteria bacterium]|nr:PSD1 domain-containing protein [Acidobacteriota bacterium]